MAGDGEDAGAETAQVEQRVRAALEASRFPFERIAVDPDLADTENFCAHYGYPLETSANCILVASKKPEGYYAACVVTAPTRLDVNKTVRKRMGVRRLSFAPPELTRSVTGMMIGGVTPFGLPAELPLYVDPRVMALEQAIFGGGSRSWKIQVSPRALHALPNAVAIVEGLALQPQPEGA